MITPELANEIIKLSEALRARFSPPEFIPGCLVKSVTDVSLYATNNGWIEALCGKHNQQRVRWKSGETVAVNDFIDVLYFPDRRLFEAYGIGGAGAISAGGGGTPSDSVEDETSYGITPDAGVATEYSRGDHTHGTPSAVGGPGPIINGAFQVWQRGTSFPAVVSGTYTADRFGYGAIGAMIHTISRSTDVPTVAQADVLAPYSYLVDCTTVDSSIAAGDFTYIYHVIEGYNFLGLAQRAITLSFWVKATKTGVYCVSLRNSGADRSYIAEYTVSVTNTWEFKTVTITASPTAGTWNYTTGAGLLIGWALAAGSTFHTTAGAWQTGSFLSTANQVNACDSTSNDFRLALVKVEPGSADTPFVMPDFQQELARCQRYYHKSYDLADAPGTVTNNGVIAYVSGSSTFGEYGPNVTYPTRMRAIPTATVYSPNSGTSGKKYNASDTVDENMTGYNVAGEQGHSGSDVAHVATKVYRYHFTASAEI